MKYFSPEQLWMVILLAVLILGLTGFRMWGG